MHKSGFIAGFIIVISLIYFFTVSCNEKCPNCPGDNETISDYNIVLSSPHAQAPRFYVYNTREKTIVDSVELDHL